MAFGILNITNPLSGLTSIDPTPGFNFGNVVKTQTHKVFGGGSPAAKTSAPVGGAPAQSGDVGGGTGGSGGTGGTGGAGAADPYAQFGGQAKYNALVSGFNNQKQGIYNSASGAAGATGDQLGRSILDFLDSQRVGQQGIDNQAAKNELAKIQGTNGVLGMVGRGIKSGGVMLAGKNAGSSSAAQGIANAYGEQGRRQLSSIGNQYELGNQDVQQAQDAFGVQQASGVRAIQGSKNDAINNIVNAAQDKFYALDGQMANASLPDRIAIEQEKQSVRNQVMQQLQGFDSQLQQGVQGIRATSADDRRAKGQQLAQAGTQLGADAFNYTDETPLDLQGTGPSASPLPLYTLGRKQYQ